MYEALTKYLGKLNEDLAVFQVKQKESMEKRGIDTRWLSSFLSPLTDQFVHEAYKMTEEYPEINDYFSYLSQHGINFPMSSFKDIDVDHLDGTTVLALILFTLRADHFDNGALNTYIQDGTIDRLLKRLKDIDAAASKNQS